MVVVVVDAPIPCPLFNLVRNSAVCSPLVEVVCEDCQARKLNKEDAMDRCNWRKVIKEAQ